MRAAGVELPVSQVLIVKRGGRTVARLDFIYVDLRLIIELDGERYHTPTGAHSALIGGVKMDLFRRAIES